MKRSALADRTNSLEKKELQQQQPWKFSQSYSTSSTNQSATDKFAGTSHTTSLHPSHPNHHTTTTTLTSSKSNIQDALKIAKAKSNARLKGYTSNRVHTNKPHVMALTSSQPQSKTDHVVSSTARAKSKPAATSSTATISQDMTMTKNRVSHHPVATRTKHNRIIEQQHTISSMAIKSNHVKMSPEKKRKHSHNEDNDVDMDHRPIGVYPSGLKDPSLKTSVPATSQPLANTQIATSAAMISSSQEATLLSQSTTTVNRISTHNHHSDAQKNNETTKTTSNSQHLYKSQQAKEDNTRVSEYEQDIFEYMHELDLQTMVDPNYMQRQGKIDWNMRRILIDWLVQVHNRFSLLPETIFLCVSMMDRFLDTKEVSVEKFQLRGITCLFIACKYEEEQCPTVSDLVYMVDNSYTSDEIVAAERFVLGQLKYKVGYSGPLNFMRRISKADGYEPKIRTLCKYFVEVTLMDERFLVFSCAKIAAAGMYLARRILYEKEWVSFFLIFIVEMA